MAQWLMAHAILAKDVHLRESDFHFQYSHWVTQLPATSTPEGIFWHPHTCTYAIIQFKTILNLFSKEARLEFSSLNPYLCFAWTHSNCMHL